ncbi:MAG: hypothetical protein V1702_05150 [Candidatus Woesearchaeota archaeon]
MANQSSRWSRKRIMTLKELLSDRASMAAGIALGITISLFFSYVKPLVAIAFFIIIGAASLLYNRFIKVSLGFELIMLVTVLAGFLYGIPAALITGVTAMFLAFLVTGHFTQGSIVSFIGIAAVSLLIPFFKGMGITTAGIILTVVYDAIIAAGYLALGSRIERTALFVATHILFNIWVFMVLAPRIYGLLA